MRPFFVWPSLSLAFALSIAWPSEFAAAQDVNLYRAPSDVSGNAGSELANLRRRDIGVGYSGSSINRQSLSQASVSTPYVGGYTGRTTVGGINTGLAGPAEAPAASFGVSAPRPAAKPFSGISTGPTVSPYLNLFREDLDGFSDFNYQTLVRPQVQQMEINQNLQRQQLEINRQVQSLAARPAFTPQGSQQQYPTGHATMFNNLSHYFPAAQQRRR